MIPKVTLRELHEEVFLRASLVAIPNLERFFDMKGGKTSHWKVFYRIIKSAVKKFEFHYQYNFIQKLYLEVDPIKKTALVIDNFKQYLDGIIAEDQINIIPSAVIGLAYNAYMTSTFPERRFRYEPPYLRDFWYSNKIWWANTLIRRPFFEEYEKESTEPTDRCAIYFMNKDVDSQYGIFEDQCYVELCRYIVNMKKNITLPNLPIEVFLGLEEDMQRMDAQLETTYMSALPSGSYLL